MWVFDFVHAQVWPTITEIVTDHRGIFVCIFILPISVTLNIYHYIMQVLLERLSISDETHAGRVATIALSVRKQASTGAKLTTDRPGYATMSLKGDDHKKNTVRIPMRKILTGIVEFDAAAQTIKVEPLVNMGQISRFLIAKGWTLAVLPELDDLTVGGLLMGFGIESTSHIFGLFQEICVEFEVVLGSGEVVKARADNEYADLFHALPWSYGTLGLLVGATLKVIPSKPFVRLSYRKYGSAAKLTTAFAGVAALRDKERALFIEALAFSPESGVVMVGSLADSAVPTASDPPATRFNDIGLWFKKWFYQHVTEVTDGLDDEGVAEVVEYVPLRSYCHRHTKGVFWEMQYIIPFADQAWFRYLFGWAAPPSITLMKVSQTKAMRQMWLTEFVVQDMLVPMRTLKESLTMMDQEIGIYPVWLCPHLVKRNPHGGFLQVSFECPADAPDEMFVDIGVYGVPTRRPYVHTTVMPRIEAFVRAHQGYQGLYAVSYMGESEFRTMFHHELYDACRSKYGAKDRFPKVFDKTCGLPSI